MPTLREKTTNDIEFYQRVLRHMIKEEKNIGVVPNLKKELKNVIAALKKLQQM